MYPGQQDTVLGLHQVVAHVQQRRLSANRHSAELRRRMCQTPAALWSRAQSIPRSLIMIQIS